MSFPPQWAVERVVGHGVVRRLEWRDRTGSTNADLSAAATAGEPAGLVIGTDLQTAGRGRRGRSWSESPGRGLALSVLLRPSLPTSRWPLLPLVAGLAVHDAAASVVGAERIGLKWPNDLLLDGTKTSGVLVEALGDAVVVGMGVNVDWRGVDRPADLRATSLAEAVDGDVDRAAVLVELLEALGRWVDLAETDPEAVVPAYVTRCATLGTDVVVHGPSPVTGRAVGLTHEGHLRVRREDGTEVVVSAGDVEHLRPAG
ncbi:biotin--[acetyl-CoA-carboxylase] ligase [Euzebya rosea]|uniref:biotin--[acetyl-CoA-carboxylase] ligase n=1 Tax=Euzebya rosea TaxID=2052804 RepID=UPI000D3EAD64|nr:biotin--[acetyl-CoA-carboxylase] ligase [Euzebya rosea]